MAIMAECAGTHTSGLVSSDVYLPGQRLLPRPALAPVQQGATAGDGSGCRRRERAGRSSAGGDPQDSTRRITSRGILLATASVTPITSNPACANIDRVPTKAMVRSIRPSGSTG